VRSNGEIRWGGEMIFLSADRRLLVLPKPKPTTRLSGLPTLTSGSAASLPPPPRHPQTLGPAAHPVPLKPPELR
jgi:hypothetical protein